MACQIQDTFQYYNNALTGVPLQNQQILAVPAANFYRISITSAYRMIAQNPAITTAAYKYGIVATTSSSGVWSITLPYGASETLPATPDPTWMIIFPDGRIIQGVVPSVAGPITVNALLQTYAWTQIDAVYTQPLTPGALAEGVATITADTTAAIVFATAFASTPRIQLTASLDTVTSAAVTANYSSLSNTGFTINMGGTFTGTVCWSARL